MMEVIAVGAVAAHARRFSMRGRQLLTVIVKSSFVLRPDAVMELTGPVPVTIEERRVSHSPIASVSRASDTALVVPLPEIVVVGSAHPPPGSRVTHATVSLELVRNGATLLAKSIRVLGDRRGPSPPEPLPFERMPIVYERALGSIRHPDNPVGVGVEVGADGLVTWPNLYPASADARTPTHSGSPAGFGPLSAVWSVRKAKRGSMTHAEITEAPYVELPSDFDEAYFQTAPVDQRLSELCAGDTIVLTGMHPRHPKLRVTIPELTGIALVETSPGLRQEQELRLDTIHLEPNGLRGELVWRSSALLPARSSDAIRVAASVRAPGQPLDLEAALRAPARTSPDRPVASPIPSLGGTQVIEPNPPAAAASPRGAGTMIIEAPASSKPIRTASTMIIEAPSADDGPARHPHPLLERRAATMEIATDVGPRSLPFAGRQSRPEETSRASSPSMSKSPWGDAKDLPKPQPALPSQKETMLPSGDLATEAAIEAELEARAAKANRPLAPRPPEPARDDKPLWRESPAEPSPPVNPRPAAPPKADLRGQIYKKKRP